MLLPFPIRIKITYYPAWIPYCNTIRRDRAGNYASSPYHAVFSYSVTPGRRIQPPPIQTLLSISIGRA